MTTLDTAEVEEVLEAFFFLNNHVTLALRTALKADHQMVPSPLSIPLPPGVRKVYHALLRTCQ